jgi:hypothetical protein
MIKELHVGVYQPIRACDEFIRELETENEKFKNRSTHKISAAWRNFPAEHEAKLDVSSTMGPAAEEYWQCPGPRHRGREVAA